MNETDKTKTEQETNLIKRFLIKHVNYVLDRKKTKIAEALRLSRYQFRRLETGEAEIQNYIKERLWRLDHFLMNDGKLEDFYLPEYGEDDPEDEEFSIKDGSAIE